MKGIILEKSIKTREWFLQDTVTNGIIPVHPDYETKCVPGLLVEYDVQTIAVGTSEFDVVDCDVACLHIDKKQPKIQYGITITKPWSKEMYDHNDLVATEVKKHIRAALDKAMVNYVDPELSCDKNDHIYIIAKELCGYGWSNYSAEDIYNEAVQELERVQNYWLNDIYPYLQAWGYVPALSTGFVGY